MNCIRFKDQRQIYYLSQTLYIATYICQDFRDACKKTDLEADQLGDGERKKDGRETVMEQRCHLKNL